jgi:hypothetical protein
MRVKLLEASALMVFLAVPVFAQNPAAGQQRIRGTVESFNAPTLLVKADDGQSFSIIVPAELRIMANAKSSLADIKPGDFVGSAAIKGADGKMHAQEVHIFPEAMRGTGEGHRPMAPDPTANISGVAGEPQERTMTNATVTGVQSRTLTLKYKDGEAEIVVAPDVPIITLVVGDASLLKPGAAVAIVAVKKDAGLVATNLTAEKDGVKPR